MTPISRRVIASEPPPHAIPAAARPRPRKLPRLLPMAPRASQPSTTAANAGTHGNSSGSARQNSLAELAVAGKTPQTHSGSPSNPHRKLRIARLLVAGCRRGDGATVAGVVAAGVGPPRFGGG